MRGRSKLARQAGGGGHVVPFTLYPVPCQRGWNLTCAGQSVSLAPVNMGFDHQDNTFSALTWGHGDLGLEADWGTWGQAPYSGSRKQSLN